MGFQLGALIETSRLKTHKTNSFGKSLLVVKAQVGETRHKTLIGLFEFSHLSGQMPSFLQ